MERAQAAGLRSRAGAGGPLRPSIGPGATAAPSGLPGKGLFVGRETEKAALIDAILGDDPRPILILGPPGIGKSALTRQALHDQEIIARFGDRRWFVRLDAASDERALWTTILAQLGSDMPGADPAAQVLARLGDGDGLLVLDNLEAPWNADEGPVEEALARLADVTSVRIVASIRGTAWPSRVDWWRPPSLEPLPADQAGELFLRVAGEDYANDPDLEAMVAALDGLPLAIELLARQAQGSRTLSGLRADFEERKGKLFELGDTKELSLKASLQLSLDSPKMTGAAKRLFTTMGRLPAGAAEEDLNKLISGGGHRAGRVLSQLGLAFEDSNRLRMLAPIREHAALRPMRDVTPILKLYLGLAKSEGDRIGEAGGADAAARLKPEVTNLEAVIDLATRHGQASKAVPAISGFTDLLRFTGVGSAKPLVRLLALFQRTREQRSVALCQYRLGMVELTRSLHEAAGEHFRAALGLFRELGDEQNEANCIFNIGLIASGNSRYDEARKCCETALMAFRNARDILGQANCTHVIGVIALRRSDHEAAQEHFGRAMPLYQEVGDVLGEANCIKSLGDIAFRRSDHDTAKEHFECAMPLYREVGSVQSEASCILSLGEIAFRRSDHDVAQDYYQRAMALYQKVGDVQGEANCIFGFSDIALSRFDHDAAREHYQRAMTLYQKIGSVNGEANCEWGHGEIERERGQHRAAEEHYGNGLAQFRRIHDRGGEARCLFGLGQTGLPLGRADAEARLREAFSIFDEIHNLEGRGEALLELAALAESVEARRGLLLDALDSHTRFGNPRWIGETHRRLARISEGEEQQHHVAAAREAWTAIDRPDLVAELDAEFDHV